MSDITLRPRIPKYIRRKDENVTNALIHAQFKVEYFNEKTENWTATKFESTTYVLRDLCTTALKKQHRLLEPGFNSFRYQNTITIENLYNQVLIELEQGIWSSTMKSIVYDMLKATEFPGDENQDKWFFQWALSKAKQKLDRRDKGKRDPEVEVETESEVEASTSSKYGVSSPGIRRAEKEGSDAGRQKVEREVKKFKEVDEKGNKRFEATSWPRIANTIAASPPTAPPTIAPRGGPDVLKDVGITVSKVTEVPEVIEASEGKDVCTSVELSDKLEDDATVISDEKATEDEAAAVGVTIVVGGLDIDVTRVL
ncbi:hypothetical protein TWF217_001769 [Orbilia oligospora]|nr:hypothetical protein TWF217_001769 [Orbilia oligospora]KAF3276489.1 hypothetical protein TWF132_002145 [Orbilia oligospora]